MGALVLLFCPPGINCVNPGKVLVVSWFVGLVLFCPPPGAKLTKPGSVFVVVIFCPAPPGGCKLFNAGFDNDKAGFDNDGAELNEVWFDGVEEFPCDL
jgi:hypothetical protein